MRASLIVSLLHFPTSCGHLLQGLTWWDFNETQVAHASLMVARSAEIVRFLVGRGEILKVFMLEQGVGTGEGEMCELPYSTIAFCFGTTTRLSPKTITVYNATTRCVIRDDRIRIIVGGPGHYHPPYLRRCV